ncbi:MAG: hypothetical protein M3P40_10865 [Actinomycetota bacterium]|nr:hypothetical protein [Actinomycetota bacterium]
MENQVSEYKVLILGASYGSLLATKLLMAGHSVKLVCLPHEADLINREGTRVRMPIRDREQLVEIDSRQLPGKLSADVPTAIDPKDFDLVGLAMQEPQYRSPGVRELVESIATNQIPCMSIMNMPPLTYLKRLPGVDADACRHCYTDATVWDSFDPKYMTLCSPDPQAFRPPEEELNVLQVRLPTNFKAARFESDEHTAMLREIEQSIDDSRFTTPDGEEVEVPVKLRVSDSVFVPLAKWAMLMAGNYRCFTADGMRPIRDAIHTDLEQSRSVYNWVVDLSKKLGAAEEDLVPFEKYATAGEGLLNPSSVARAAYGGAQYIERVDCVVKSIATQQGLSCAPLDEIVSLVDAKLEENRQAVPA